MKAVIVCLPIKDKVLIPIDSIKIEKRAYNSIVKKCKEKKIDPKSLYFFYKSGNIHIGFQDNKKDYATLNSTNWSPQYFC